MSELVIFQVEHPVFSAMWASLSKAIFVNYTVVAISRNFWQVRILEMRNVFKEIFDKNWTYFWFMLDFHSVFARLPLEFRSTMLEIEQKIMLEKWFMFARFCSRSKVLEAFSARARLGSKIISCDIARARLGSKIFSLGSLELEKFTLVPNTNSFYQRWSGSS